MIEFQSQVPAGEAEVPWVGGINRGCKAFVSIHSFWPGTFAFAVA